MKGHRRQEDEGQGGKEGKGGILNRPNGLQTRQWSAFSVKFNGCGG